MKNEVLSGKLDAGNPHARFIERVVALENPRRGSLLCETHSFKVMLVVAMAVCAMLSAGAVETREALIDIVAGRENFGREGGWLPYRAHPGCRPFRGPETVRVATKPTFEGTVTLRLKNFKTGKVHERTASWQDETALAFNLPADERFVIQELVFWAKDRDFGKEKFDLTRIDATFRVPSAEVCKVDVVTGNPMHIARDGKEAPVVTLTNQSSETQAWKGRFLLADLAGHTLKLPFEVTVAAGETKGFALGWPLPGQGHWIVYAEIAGADGSSVRRELSFAILDRHIVTPRLADGKFRMGINYHYERMTKCDRRITMDALVACGAKLARIDFGMWCSAQPGEGGPIMWDSFDECCEDFLSHGIDMDGMCWGCPQWAARPECRTNAIWQTWVYGLPERTDLAEAYYRKLAERYGTKIAYYELGNEWEGCGGFQGTADEAIAVQKLCYAALKRGNPSVKVISNGWGNWDSENPQVTAAKKGFPERVMKEAHGFYDAHPIHNHGTFPDFRHAITTRFLPRRHEMGIDDVPWYSNEAALTGIHGNEVNVAEHVWKKILFAWAYGSRDYIWYNLRATGWDPNDPEMGYGMLTADYYPRPSYSAFSALAALLSGFDFDTIIKSQATREIYRFRGVRDGSRQMVVAGWDSALAGGTEIRVETDAKKAWQVDFMGNRTPVVIRDGVCTWVLGRRPSALLLVDATGAKPDAKAIDAIPASAEKPIVVAKGRAAERPADLTAENVVLVHCFYDGNPFTIHRTWQGVDDASFRVWFGRQRGALAMRVLVRDDIHCQSAKDAPHMSEGDCVRISLDVAGKGPRWELGFRLTDGGKSEACVWEGRREVLKDIAFTATRVEKETDYRIVLPLEMLGLTEQKLADGDLRISVKVDDNDGEGRDLWIGLENMVPLRFTK